MKKTMKKLGSLLLILCTVLTMMPSVVLASATDVQSVTITSTGTKLQYDKSASVQKTMQMTAKVAPDTANQEVTWSVDKESVATITATGGALTPKAAGSVVVTATSKADPTKSTTKTITVVDITGEKLVSAISVVGKDNATTVDKDSTLDMSASVTTTDAKDPSVTWSVSDTSIATIGATGTLSGVKVGTVTVYAAAKDGSGVVGSASIQVKEPAKKVTSITVSAAGDATEVAVGSDLAMTADVQPEDAADKTVTWSVNDESIATIADGTLHGVAPGNVTVTATANDGSGIFGTEDITVKAPDPVLVTEIDVTAKDDNYIIDPEVTLQMNATITPSEATNSDVTWSVDKSDIATIDQNGILTSKKGAHGIVKVTATAQDGSGVMGSKEVLVVKYVSKVTIEGASSVKAGETSRYTATVEPDDASDKSVKWSVEDKTGSATIDQNGLLTAKKAGTVIVQAVPKDVLESVTLNGMAYTNSVTATEKEVTITADEYNITFKTEPTAGGTPSATVGNTVVTKAAAGSKVSLAGNAATGYIVKGFSYEIDGATKTDATFTMPAANVSVTVTYSKIQLTISATASPTAGGTITGTGQVAYGGNITLKATAKTGYTFSYWKEKDGTTKLSTNASFTIENVTENKAYVAVFTKKSTTSTTSTKKATTTTAASKSATATAAGAKTGDATNIWLWIVVLAVCAGGIGYVVYKKRKAKE